MKNKRIKALLFLTILTMTILPLITAFYFLDYSLQTSLNLGFNPEIVRVLHTASQNLKRLKITDSKREPLYREQFEEIKNLQLVYSKPDLVKNKILNSLKIYFGLGLLASFFLSIAIAALLSKRISHSYSLTFDELMKQNERVRYLEEISSWQDLAKMLAHEIKNPLTPIEVLVTSLMKSYLNKTEIDFKEQLTQTELMITEELRHLKNIVNRFSEFSRIPKIHLMNENLIETIHKNIKYLSENNDHTQIEFTYSQNTTNAIVPIDSTLFKQVFSNIVRNGIEANPGKNLHFKINLLISDELFQIEVGNDGVPVPKEIAGRIFDPYVSGKTGKENMGLGLAIVKKIIIEHGGEISYIEKSHHPIFVISVKRKEENRLNA